jgi:hypothetical protein
LTAALLTHEQSLTLVPVCWLAGVLLTERPELVSRTSWWWWRTRELLPAAALVGVYLGLKLALSDGTDLAPGLAEGLAGRVGPFLLHLLRVLVPNLSKAWAWQILDPPLPGWAANLARLALVIPAGLVFLRLTPRLKLLALWTGLHVGVMVLAIGMASRHYYLPLVPASLLVASLLVRLSEKAAERTTTRFDGRLRRVAVPWLLPLLAAPLIVAGLITVASRKAVWSEASALSQDLLDQVAVAAREAPAARSLVVVDLPDGLPLEESDPAYLFRLGFEDALKLRRIGPPFAGITRLHAGSTEPWKEPFGRLATDAEILALASDPANLVLRYDPEAQRFRRARHNGTPGEGPLPKQPQL